MKCELLTEHNLALMFDFIDDENTKYDETVLKAFLHEKSALYRTLFNQTITLNN